MLFIPLSLIVCVTVSLQGRGALQDIDQMSLFKPLCKFCASVRTVREIVPTVRKALAVAQSGTPGTTAHDLSHDLCKLEEFIGGGGGGFI